MGLVTRSNVHAAVPDAARRELTGRGLLLGALITLVFTAANVYLGLKVGLTFASSIPAAVISMAVLRAFKSATIYENNIVQTVASAAGTLSSIIFVLPGLVMVGWWTGFPFWQSFGVCAVGGILGVMYTVPLRRALVTESDLPYPEGVAAAEVLKVGAQSAAAGAENRAGLLAVCGGAIASAAFAAITAARLFAEDIAFFFRAGPAATGIDVSLSLALLGAGHLVGLSVGAAMFGGFLLAWGIATPVLTAQHVADGSAQSVATAIWAHKVRFIGAGAIGISALWTLGKLARPVLGGVLSALAVARRSPAERAGLPRTERDIPIGIVGLVSVVCLFPLAALLAAFLYGTPLTSIIVPLTLVGTLYVVLAGFLVAATCGYMAGLIGSSNSPVSGVAILAVLGAALALFVLSRGLPPAAGASLVAYALFVTAVVICVATIANDNLQDLKTGQLVDATPWRQQVALVVGVVVGAAIIPPILDLLDRAYGFAGSPNLHAGAINQPLPAPQATLISALAKGVLQGQLDWGLIGVGALAGIAIIGLDEFLGARKRLRLPPLAVGIGIYLPAATTLTVALGALIGWGYERWTRGAVSAGIAQRLGILLASGLIVGESLFGVAQAGLIVGSNRGEPLALVGAAFAPWAGGLGGVAFIAVIAGLYAWCRRLAARAGG